MASQSWRPLPFFTQSLVKDANDAASTPEVFRTPAEISAIFNSSHGLLVADIHGGVHILRPNFEPLVRWQAHTDGRVTHMVEKQGVLITLGEEKSSRLPLLKIWDLEHRDKSTKAPTLLRSTKVQHGNRPDPVTTIALSDSLSHLAIGLADGSVLIYRHLDQSIFSSSSSLTALPKPKTIHEPSPNEPITGLGFREPFVSPSFTSSSSTSHPHDHHHTNTYSSIATPDLQAENAGTGANAEPHSLSPREREKSEKEREKDASLILFIVTTNRVLSYVATGKGSGAAPTLVDDVGCGLGCATMYGGGGGEGKSSGSGSGSGAGLGSGQEMVLARDDAIYLCNPDGRGACYVIEWPKISVTAFRNYLILLSPPFFPSLLSPSATVRNHVVRSGPGSTSIDVSKITILDMENKITAFSEATFAEGVREVWGDERGKCVFVLGNDGKLFRLTETPTPQKLSILFSKASYQTALGLAHAEGLPPDQIAQIHKQYGDYLYGSKGDYEGAREEYVRTLGWVQPSYVIRKFLDAQQIHNLATYLQELHSRGLANADHTTLLLNTYAKLGDVARLDEFIRSAEKRSKISRPKAHSHRHSSHRGHHGHGGGGELKGGRERDLPFDLETAIRVCRQAGYYEHAAYLAKTWGRHDDYLRIQIEDKGVVSATSSAASDQKEKNADDGKGDARKDGVREAVMYLRALGPELAAAHLVKYGRTLLSKSPDETTQLLIDICSGVRDLTLATKPTTTTTTTNGGGSSSHVRQSTIASGIGMPYLNILNYNRPNTNANANANAQDANTNAANASSPQSEEKTPLSEVEKESPGAITPSDILPREDEITYRIPRPSQYFAHFVDSRTYFITFLETIAARRWGQRVDIGTGANAPPPAPPPAKVMTTTSTTTNVEDDDREDQTAIWNTLLELYLTTSASSASSLEDNSNNAENKNESANSNSKDVNAFQQRAMHVLTHESTLPYDTTHALILCSTHGFMQGLLYLWDKMGMHEEVLRYWIDRETHPGPGSQSSFTDGKHASEHVVSSLSRYGPAHHHLYTLVLRFLTSSLVLLSRHSADIKRILDEVEREGIIPPVEVVKILSRNEVVSVGLVKEWLMRRIVESREGIEADKELIDSYRTETQAKLKEISTLSDPEHPKVFQATRCSVCGIQLDLPAIHFMCNHSYHQRCLNDETDCPICARDHALVREIRRENQSVAAQHEAFLYNVDVGGFPAIASMFSKGILGRGVETS